MGCSLSCCRNSPASSSGRTPPTRTPSTTRIGERGSKSRPSWARQRCATTRPPTRAPTRPAT
eukprot:1517667-Prymnesium_polylepis.1